MLSVGLGYDLHRLVPGRKLILGGVEIPSSVGSLAHSDGDALLHAITDSLLSPAGAGDIGTLFPDNDKKNLNRDSLEILKEVYEKYLKSSKILHLDCVVVLDSPKIAPFIAEMKKKIAGVLNLPENRIGIKGKTTENTRIFTVECHVVSLLDQATDD